MPMIDFYIDRHGCLKACVEEPRWLITEPEHRLRVLCLAYFRAVRQLDLIERVKDIARVHRRDGKAAMLAMRARLDRNKARVADLEAAILHRLKRGRRHRGIVIVGDLYIAPVTGRRDSLDNPVPPSIHWGYLDGRVRCPACLGSSYVLDFDNLPGHRRCDRCAWGMAIDPGIPEWLESLPVSNHSRTQRKERP